MCRAAVGGGDDFCVNGRQLPALFVIGAQKCGTTSLSDQLFDEYGFSRGWAFTDGRDFSDSKEHHFFDHQYRIQQGLGFFASTFPACGGNAHPVATLDATPNYFTSSAAWALKSMYGDSRVRRTTFAFLLCDPVQRAQSAFYHFKQWGSSFKAWSHAHRSDASQSLWKGGLYGPNLDAWLSAVGHAIVIPSTDFYAGAANTLNQLVASYAARAGRAVPGGRGYHSSAHHDNSHSHLSLSDDHYSGDRSQIRSIFASSNEHVYSLLHDGRVTTLPHAPCSAECAAGVHMLPTCSLHHADVAPHP